jgi:cytochrome P450
MLGGTMIPAGTCVTTSSYYPDMNPVVFDRPNSFDPQRWARATPEMTRSICAFSKGRRQCPAKQMAMSEIYIAFAALLHGFTFEAYETT